MMIDIKYFRVIFYYCKIRPGNRKNFTIDRSKFLVKRWLFSTKILIQGFKDSFLLFNHFVFTEICKELKLQIETKGLN